MNHLKQFYKMFGVEPDTTWDYLDWVEWKQQYKAFQLGYKLGKLSARLD
jgi:hypothetical protein